MVLVYGVGVGCGAVFGVGVGAVDGMMVVMLMVVIF